MSALKITSLAFLCCLFAAGTARAQDRLCRFEYNSSPGTEITIQSVFGQIPSWGYMPARVTIKNGSTQARSWQIRITSRDNHFNEQLSLRSSFSLSSGPQSEVTHEILVPLTPILNSGAYRQQIGITVDGSGLPGRADTYYSQFSKDWPCIGISEELAENNLGKLDEKVKKSVAPAHANEHFGLRFKVAELPKDWRGLVGLDSMMMTDKEWRKLAPGRRQAVLQWQRMGGGLHIYTESKTANLAELGFTDSESTAASGDLEPSDQPGGKKKKKGAANRNTSKNRSPQSLGFAVLETWDGRDLDIEKTFDTHRVASRKATSLTKSYASNWDLQDTFGTKDFNRTLILFVLLIFGVLVGPVNLWVFAKPGNRHRMFVTTPLLSIGASIVMALMILFSDGIGGDGLSFTAINLEPGTDERKAYVLQEQLSRTGLLLGRSFDVDEDIVMSPVNLRQSPWSQFDSGSNRRNSLRIQGDKYDGDWFRSRSEVAHVLQTVRTTRARIERIRNPGGEIPLLYSSLEYDVDQLYYIDENGAIWKSKAPAGTGQEIPLAEVDKPELTDWWNEQTAAGSTFLRTGLRGLTGQKNLFFATTTDPDANPLRTGTFIRWKSEPILVFGHLLEVETRRPPEA